jgi:MFS family permease
MYFIFAEELTEISIPRSIVRILWTKANLHRLLLFLYTYFPGSTSLIAVWQIPCAAAQNIQTLLVGRFLAGFSGSAFLSVAGGSITDIWNKSEVSWPMELYTVGPFLGPTVGPLIGGFINYNVSWRWTFYVIIVWASAEVFSRLYGFG